MKPAAAELIDRKLASRSRAASVDAVNAALEAHGRRLVIVVAQAEDGAVEVGHAGDDVEVAASWFADVAKKLARVEDLLTG